MALIFSGTPPTAPQVLTTFRALIGMDRSMPKESRLNEAQAVQIFHGPVEGNEIPDEIHLEARCEDKGGRTTYTLFAIRKDRIKRALIGRPPHTAKIIFDTSFETLDVRVSEGRWFLRVFLEANNCKYPHRIDVMRRLMPSMGFGGEIYDRLRGFQGVKQGGETPTYRCDPLEREEEPNGLPWMARYVRESGGDGFIFKLTPLGRLSTNLWLHPILLVKPGSFNAGDLALEGALQTFVDAADRLSLSAWEGIEDPEMQDVNERGKRVIYLIEPDGIKNILQQRPVYTG